MASSPCGRSRPWPAVSLLLLALLELHLVASTRGAIYTTVGDEDYSITITNQGTVPELWGILTNTPWWGNPPLAEGLAAVVADGFGSVNPDVSLGPFFAYGGTVEAVDFAAWSPTDGVVITARIPADIAFVFAMSFEEWGGAVLWVPQFNLDCRATCGNAFMLAVSSMKPTEAIPNPPLLCANIGALQNDPTLTVPGSLAYEPYRFFLSEGYTQPMPANKLAGRPAEHDALGCSSYLEDTTPDANYYLCGCVPPRKSVDGTATKPWRWVPLNATSCIYNDVPFDGYSVPFICRVRATGLIGHLNIQNCGFPSAENIDDCVFARQTTQPASGFPTDLNMPPAKPDFPDCMYVTRTGVYGTTQGVATYNNIDKLCIVSSFKYYIYRWPKQGVNSSP